MPFAQTRRLKKGETSVPPRGELMKETPVLKISFFIPGTCKNEFGAIAFTESDPSGPTEKSDTWRS